MTGQAGGTIRITKPNGIGTNISSSTIFMTLGVGWAAFVLSIIFNVIYYALHPSQARGVCSSLDKIFEIFSFQVDLLNIREKLVVALLGFEINLITCSTRGSDSHLDRNILRETI